jgi:hypothetical protein
MTRVLARLLQGFGILLSTLGSFFAVDGMLPTRSHGPAFSVQEVTLGVCILLSGLCFWSFGSWLLRRSRVSHPKQPQI